MPISDQSCDPKSVLCNFEGPEGPSLLARVDSLEDDTVLHLPSVVLDPRPTLVLVRGDPRLRSDVEGF